MKKLYKHFVRSGNPIILKYERSAELTKDIADNKIEYFSIGRQ